MFGRVTFGSLIFPVPLGVQDVDPEAEHVHVMFAMPRFEEKLLVTNAFVTFLGP